MEKDKTKNEGPSCACGTEELFEPLEKLNKKEKPLETPLEKPKIKQIDRELYAFKKRK